MYLACTIKLLIFQKYSLLFFAPKGDSKEKEKRTTISVVIVGRAKNIKGAIQKRGS